MTQITKKTMTNSRGRMVKCKFSDLDWKSLQVGDVIECVRNIGTNRAIMRGKRYKVVGMTDKTQVVSGISRNGVTMETVPGHFVTFAGSRFVKS